MNHTVCTILTLAIVWLGACDDDGDKANQRPAPGPAKPVPKKAVNLVAIDIVHEDVKATMNAPEGAVFKESLGTLEIKVGDGREFFVQIDTDAPDMGQIKSSIKNNDVQRLIKFFTDTADTYIYETEAFGRRSFWLDTAVDVGGKTVHCKSGRGAHSYTKAHIAAMEQACKSLRPKG